MRISKWTYFLLLLLVAFYAAALLYLKQNYDESRWIPKTILTLPRFVEDNIASSADDSLSVAAPQVEPVAEGVADFHILFDNVPLESIDLIRPWYEETQGAETYARPAEFEDKPKMAILLTDVGLNADLFDYSIRHLPSFLTLSFSPYTLDLAGKIKKARMAGFENMMEVVVESEGALDNGGVYALRNGQFAAETDAIFQKAYFDLAVPFIGFWSEDEVSLSDVKATQIAPYGLISLSPEQVDWVERNNLYPSAITNLLNQSLQKAAQNGQFILVLPMRPAVVEAIIQWFVSGHSDVSLVPVSALIEEVQND